LQPLVVVGALILGGAIFVILLVMLFLAPMKLYDIHRELRRTNELLAHNGKLLSRIDESQQAQVKMIAAAANKLLDVPVL
jgi:hypothetical protein